MTGIYTLESVWPHCKAVQTPVRVVEWRGNRVLLADLEMERKGISYFIETDLSSFQPDIPETENNNSK